eukprot:Pgem_evm1s5118
MTFDDKGLWNQLSALEAVNHVKGSLDRIYLSDLNALAKACTREVSRLKDAADDREDVYEQDIANSLGGNYLDIISN